MKQDQSTGVSGINSIFIIEMCWNKWLTELLRFYCVSVYLVCYRDASNGPVTFSLTLLDCFQGIYKVCIGCIVSSHFNQLLAVYYLLNKCWISVFRWWRISLRVNEWKLYSSCVRSYEWKLYSSCVRSYEWKLYSSCVRSCMLHAMKQDQCFSVMIVTK